MTAPAAPAPAAGGHLLSLAAVIATAAIFGLTYSLSASLIALDLAERGARESVIGLNAAMHALGVLAIALVLPRLVPRIGPRRLILVALLAAAAVLALLPADARDLALVPAALRARRRLRVAVHAVGDLG